MKYKYEWKERAHCWYYYNTATGKIIGKSNKIALTDICIALVYTGMYTFTIDDEKHLGEYIDSDFAKKAVENYWDVENRTLLAGPPP